MIGCITPHCRLLGSAIPVHFQLLQVTVPQVGTTPPATALEQFYPREIHPRTPLMQGNSQNIIVLFSGAWYVTLSISYPCLMKHLTLH